MATKKKGRDLLFANKPRIVPWGTERMLQRIQKHRRVTSHRSAHPKRDREQTEKSSYDRDWLRKVLWYGPAKLHDKLPQNVQNIRWSHKLYRENHENLESGIDKRRENVSWGKNPKKYFSRKCIIPVNIHNCHDATSPHAQKMHSRLQT